MRRTWTIIGVVDVSGSFKWYQSLLGLSSTAALPRMTISARSSTLMEQSCSAFTSGAYEHPSLASRTPRHLATDSSCSSA